MSKHIDSVTYLNPFQAIPALFKDAANAYDKLQRYDTDPSFYQENRRVMIGFSSTNSTYEWKMVDKYPQTQKCEKFGCVFEIVHPVLYTIGLLSLLIAAGTGIAFAATSNPLFSLSAISASIVLAATVAIAILMASYGAYLLVNAKGS